MCGFPHSPPTLGVQCSTFPWVTGCGRQRRVIRAPHHIATFSKSWASGVFKR